MDHRQDIEKLLATNRDLSELVIAPNAPPVSRTIAGCKLAMNVVFSPADVKQVLQRLHRAAFPANAPERGASGSFCLGIQDVGRFRVTYMTQRGSQVLRIVRVPLDIPALDSVCEDADLAAQLTALVSSFEPGVILFHGPSSAANSMFIYALLDEVNKSQRGIIYIMERALSYLMSHHVCIAVQTELITDVQTMEQGIANAFLFDPDIAYIGDLHATDEVPSFGVLLDAPVLTLVSSHNSGHQLRDRVAGVLGDEQSRIKAEVSITPVEAGKVRIKLA
ncbi:MAG: ATPase, T2SS/T4P/T4SS family [Kiritimatiellia bacterium]|jgi:twitching motility protein PilT|nr:ATPase, T2SS/T4P/T4SS family [Kiritimatiellia bacterium]